MTKDDPLTEKEWDELINLRNTLGLLTRENAVPMPVRKQLDMCRFIIERITHTHDTSQSCYEKAETFDNEWPDNVKECWEAIK